MIRTKTLTQNAARIAFPRRIGPFNAVVRAIVCNWRVYVNGHGWLARQMARGGLGFVQRDDAFVGLDTPQRAQQLADRFARLPWVKQLDRWARKINPLPKGSGWLRGMGCYWVVDQAEYSTDILSPAKRSCANCTRGC